ncbi:MAG: GNAT family N-acetyltransferase [Bacteroidota bacterium]|nr:GNAT family N-acetyltransferase [Bacteroidota bacterium]
MVEIIPPVETELLEMELTEEKFVRKTNNGGNLLYVFSAQDSPNLMREVGRLREESFRHGGGGTGEETDIDDFDICEDPYRQLIVWDPDARQILGGYRFKICDENTVDADGNVLLSTAELFNFSEKFCKEYLPHMIELGRSFVVPAYQSTSRGRKGMYALDNLWDGLGAIIVENPDKLYFFGKVTMYTSYNVNARNHLLYFLEKYFADKERLVTPIEPMETHMNRDELANTFSLHEYKSDYKILSKAVRNMGEIIPPLINSYMNLSPTMKFFGTAINHHFGDVEESAILVTLKDIYESKVDRHIHTYRALAWLRKLKKPNLHLFSKRRRLGLK